MKKSLAIINFLCTLWYSLDIERHVQDHDSCFNLLKSYILVFVPAPYIALSVVEIHFGARRGVELMIFIAIN